MLESVKEAVAIAAGKARKDLDADRLLNLSLVRLPDVVGEAANRVPESERLRHPQIPWAAMVGMRNRLLHAYGSIDLDIVWKIVQDDLARLVRDLERLVPPA